MKILPLLGLCVTTIAVTAGSVYVGKTVYDYHKTVTEVQVGLEKAFDDFEQDLKEMEEDIKQDFVEGMKPVCDLGVYRCDEVKTTTITKTCTVKHRSGFIDFPCIVKENNVSLTIVATEENKEERFRYIDTNRYLGATSGNIWIREGRTLKHDQTTIIF
jgi:hypothetical protein